MIVPPSTAPPRRPDPPASATPGVVLMQLSNASFVLRIVLHLSMVLLLMAGTSTAAGSSPSFSPEQVAFFETKVRPVLAASCQKCHGEAKQSSGLRLDSREAMLEGGENGPAVVSGNPDQSLMIQVVRHIHADIKMPPKGKLSETEIESISGWVKMGMPWPESVTKTGAGASDDASKTHWAFLPVKVVTPPTVKAQTKVFTPVDSFVLDRLEKAGIAPAAEADRRTLIRRLSFGLTGLPPTALEVKAFEEDRAPDAYDRVVDRLLNSPHYGEKWARHWLDVARYADTKGYVFMEERRYPFAYTYRDYVIRALNGDKPYDRFLVEQIAADRLGPENDPGTMAALGFLTVGRRFLNNREDIIDDRIDVVGRGLMGLTVACARCHDHKFDPIPTDDYYSLFGVFNSSVEPAEAPEIPASVSDALREDFHKQIAVKQKVLEEFQNNKINVIRGELSSHTSLYLKAAVDLNFEAKNPDLNERAKVETLNPGLLRGVMMRWKTKLDATRGSADPLFAPWHAFAAIAGPEFSRRAPGVAQAMASDDDPKHNNPVLAQSFADHPPGTMGEVAQRYGALLTVAAEKGREAEKSGAKTLPEPGWEPLRLVLQGDEGALAVKTETLSRLLDRPDKNTLNSLEKAVAAVRASHPGSPPRAMVMIDAPKPIEPRVLVRGNVGRPGKQVPRQFLAVLSGPDRKPFQDGSGRLELARAIASKENPLTARVLVNRVWFQHFGVGLVSTPSDFGRRSDPPSHPELLDWLADDFMSHGWSIKHLHRRIVLSSTYRQQSASRPDAVAIDPENRLVWKFNRRRLDFESLRDALLSASGALDSSVGGRPVPLADTPFTTRRTIYGYIDRQNLDGIYRTFDFASPDSSSPRRYTTIVPQQALFLMNNPFVIEQAKRLGALPELAEGLPEERVNRLYRRLFSRAPSTGETTLGIGFVQSQERSGTSGMSPWEEYAQVLLLTNEFAFVD